MIETARQNLSDEFLILLCGLKRKHRIEIKLSVNNLNNIKEGTCLIQPAKKLSELKA